jgi:hypothetical protein
MPSAEVATLIGRRFHDDPDPTTLAGGAGSACTYGSGNAQVVVFSGPRSRQLWDNYLRNFKKDKEARQPVPAAGAGAYVIYPTPRDQYEDTIGLLVVTSGAHTVGVSVAAETGQPAASVQPALVALARAVVAKLR